MEFKFNWDGPVYQNFRKNEVIRPASVGWYYILITFMAIFTLTTMISPVQAEIIWDNATNTIYSPYHWSACNVSTAQKITLDEPRSGLYYQAGYETDGVAPTIFGATVDGEGQSYVHGWWSSNQELTSVTYPGAGWNSQYYFATCADDYLMVDGFTPNTRETAYYIEPGTYLYGFVDSGGHADSTGNLTINSSEINIYIPVEGQVRVNYGVQATAELAHYQDANGQYFYFTTTPPTYIFNFTGTPTTGIAPHTVNFTIINFTGINTSASNTWHWGDGQTASVTGASMSHTYTTTGNYTVALSYTGGDGSTGTITKTDYIQVIIGNKEVNLIAQDATNNAYINGFTANVLDNTANRWTNGTYPSGVALIFTNTSSTLTAYLTATGYDPVSATKTLRADDWPEDWVVVMFRTGQGGNVTNSTLRLMFIDSETGGTPLNGVSVLLTQTGQNIVTGGSGVAQFQNLVNGSTYNFMATKNRYRSVTSGVTVNGSTVQYNVTMYLESGPQPTPTVTGGTTTIPTPTLTGAALAEYNAGQDASLMQQLRDAAPGIIGLCILVVIFGLLKMLMKWK